MRLPIFAIIFLLALSSCEKDMLEQNTSNEVGPTTSSNSSNENNSTNRASLKNETYFQDNVSFFDTRVRSLNSAKFVVELYFIDFSSSPKSMPTSIKMFGYQFLDDGSGKDQQANDGIYTSTNEFVHDSSLPYDPNRNLRSIMEAPVVHQNFTHPTDMDREIQSYNLTHTGGNGGASGIISVSCGLEFGTSGCIYDGIGWCDDCCVDIDFDDCSVSVGFLSAR